MPDSISEPRFSVEFYPSIDDYVYIATKFGNTSEKPISLYFYQAFLLVNCIGLPAFLIFSGYVFTGLVVFVLDFVALAFIIPKVNKDTSRSYFEKTYGAREQRRAQVDLFDHGLLYTADKCYSFWTWEKIEAIEETAEAIIFYLEGNGVSVRKSGFAYGEQSKLFLDFSRDRFESEKSQKLIQ